MCVCVYLCVRSFVALADWGTAVYQSISSCCNAANSPHTHASINSQPTHTAIVSRSVKSCLSILTSAHACMHSFVRALARSNTRALYLRLRYCLPCVTAPKRSRRFYVQKWVGVEGRPKETLTEQCLIMCVCVCVYVNGKACVQTLKSGWHSSQNGAVLNSNIYPRPNPYAHYASSRVFLLSTCSNALLFISHACAYSLVCECVCVRCDYAWAKFRLWRVAGRLLPMGRRTLVNWQSTPPPLPPPQWICGYSFDWQVSASLSLARTLVWLLMYACARIGTTVMQIPMVNQKRSIVKSFACGFAVAHAVHHGHEIGLIISAENNNTRQTAKP